MVPACTCSRPTGAFSRSDGHLQQHGFGFGAGPAHRRNQAAAYIMDPKVPMSYGHRSVSPSTTSTRIERDVEFLRQRLRQFGHGALAQFHLAGEAGHAAIRADLQIGVEIDWAALARGQPRGFLGVRRVGAEEDEETGPGEARRIRGASSAHLPSLPRRLPEWPPRCAHARRTGTDCPPCGARSARAWGAATSAASA